MNQASPANDRRSEAVVIIGSGPAAWTAALYSARANLNPLVFEGEPSRTMIPGGQLMFTTDVENYPGFPEAIAGPDLMERMREQAVRFGARPIQENITTVDFSAHPFTLKPSTTGRVSALTVIIATGANAKWLNVPNEARLAQSGGGVSACAVCDAALPVFRGKVLAVVGGGDSAMEEALYTTKFSRETVIIHRRDALRASPIMADRALKHPKVRILWNSRVIEVLGDDYVTGLRVEDTVTGAHHDLEVGGLFLAIGHTPNTEFVRGQLQLTPYGYIKTKALRTEASVSGVFAAGDVVDDYYRQAVTAAGMGCMAALEAERWLAQRGLGESPVLETADAAVTGIWRAARTEKAS